MPCRCHRCSSAGAEENLKQLISLLSGTPRLKVKVALRMDAASFMFGDDVNGGATVPLMELCAKELKADLRGAVGDGSQDSLLGNASVTISADTYSAEKKVRLWQFPGSSGSF